LNRSRHISTRAGFTLLELLVALAITAIISSVLFMNLSVAFNAQKAATNTLQVSRSATLAMELLSSDLQNTMQVAGAGATSTSSTSSGTTSGTSSSAASGTTAAAVSLIGNFEGTTTTDARGNPASDLIFYTTTFAPNHVDGNGEIKYVELALEKRPNGEQVLVRRVSANLLNPNSVSASQGSLVQQGLTTDTETLCRDCAGFSLRYYTGSYWQDTWDSTVEDNTVPAAVEVTLQLQRPGDDPNAKPITFTRVFAISCSTASQDTNVNSAGVGQ
jgi:prepilin-type N-terminal cleavage/methylation domain-containing protein